MKMIRYHNRFFIAKRLQILNLYQEGKHDDLRKLMPQLCPDEIEAVMIPECAWNEAWRRILMEWVLKITSELDETKTPSLLIYRLDILMLNGSMRQPARPMRAVFPPVKGVSMPAGFRAAQRKATISSRRNNAMKDFKVRYQKRYYIINDYDLQPVQALKYQSATTLPWRRNMISKQIIKMEISLWVSVCSSD